MNYGRGQGRQLLQPHQRRSPTRHSRAEGVPEHCLLKGPEKAPIHEIDTIYEGPYIGGQTRNAQKSYAKEAEEKLMTNWLINSRPFGSNKVDHISFTEEDMREVHYPHSDALVVRAIVARNRLGRMLVDNRSSVNVIFLSTYEQMNIDVPLDLFTEPLYGFTEDCITPKEIVRLAVTMGEEPLATYTIIEFLFPTEGGVATIRGNQPEARKCYRNALRKAEKKEINMMICDIEMEEALEKMLEDIEMDEAVSLRY
ncbi:Uncharacterized protein Adt_05919 [Abeliophyllum distichum]|uniref:Uncharacterized protein n=1 Tax=Abeliophyllum distichum TaxID=126358 RepID=A0ABD1V6Q2_9LAMI